MRDETTCVGAGAVQSPRAVVAVTSCKGELEQEQPALEPVKRDHSAGFSDGFS